MKNQINDDAILIAGQVPPLSRTGNCDIKITAEKCTTCWTDFFYCLVSSATLVLSLQPSKLGQGLVMLHATSLQSSSSNQWDASYVSVLGDCHIDLICGFFWQSSSD